LAAIGAPMLGKAQRLVTVVRIVNDHVGPHVIFMMRMSLTNSPEEGLFSIASAKETSS
jgi:hypothetical protein